MKKKNNINDKKLKIKIKKYNFYINYFNKKDHPNIIKMYEYY